MCHRDSTPPSALEAAWAMARPAPQVPQWMARAGPRHRPCWRALAQRPAARSGTAAMAGASADGENVPPTARSDGPSAASPRVRWQKALSRPIAGPARRAAPRGGGFGQPGIASGRGGDESGGGGRQETTAVAVACRAELDQFLARTLATSACMAATCSSNYVRRVSASATICSARCSASAVISRARSRASSSSALTSCERSARRSRPSWSRREASIRLACSRAVGTNGDCKPVHARQRHLCTSQTSFIYYPFRD